MKIVVVIIMIRIELPSRTLPETYDTRETQWFEGWFPFRIAYVVGSGECIMYIICISLSSLHLHRYGPRMFEVYHVSFI